MRRSTAVTWMRQSHACILRSSFARPFPVPTFLPRFWGTMVRGSSSTRTTMSGKQ